MTGVCWIAESKIGGVVVSYLAMGLVVIGCGSGAGNSEGGDAAVADSRTDDVFSVTLADGEVDGEVDWEMPDVSVSDVTEDLVSDGDGAAGDVFVEARVDAVSDAGPDVDAPAPFFVATAAVDKNKIVLGHYFGPHPHTIRNKLPDYYDDHYLVPSGEKGAFAFCGGLMRDRPLKKGVPFASGKDGWMVEMAAYEIAQARAVGLDGFYVNIMKATADDANWQRYEALVEAATRFPGFWVVPMIDGNGALAQSGSTEQVAAAIGEFLGRSSSYVFSDGKHLVGTFRIEAKPASWWSKVTSQLKAAGYGVRLVGVFNRVQLMKDYTSCIWAAGPWSVGADPVSVSQSGDYAGQARGLGLAYQSAILTQNVRYREGKFDESVGTAALQASWKRAIADKTSIAQVVTWSDHAESSHLRPTVHRGWAMGLVSHYMSTWWKTGHEPRVTRDLVIVSHRRQTVKAVITGGQTTFLKQYTRSHTTPAGDYVEVVAFLTKEAEVNVRIGKKDHRFGAGAGMTSRVLSATLGSVEVSATRNGETIAKANTNYSISDRVEIQDLAYVSAP